MAKIKSEIDSGIRLTPQPSDTTSQAGDLETQASGKIVQHNGTSSSPLVTEAHTATLTNKTIDGDDNTVQDLALASLKTELADANKILQRDASGIVVSGSVIPAGNLVTDSSTTTFTNKTIDGDTNTVQDLALATLKTELADANKVIQRDASGIVVSGSVIPAGNLVTDSSTQTLTNKTIDGDDNTVQDLALTSLKTNLTDASKFLVRDASGIVVSNTKDVPAGVVVGDTDTQTLTNKSLTSPLVTTGVVDDGIDLIEEASIASPSAGRRRLALKTDGKLYLRNSSGNEIVVGSGSSSGVNYVANSDAETDTTGWTTYVDSGSRPVDGTGGSADITWTRETSTPLRGTAEFHLTKDAADRQGQGVSYLIAIDRADVAKMLDISFDYEVISGTYSGGTDTTDSDLIAYIVDVTNANTIEPIPFKIQGAVVGQTYKFVGQFQSASNSTSYRLCVHVATTSASAYTVAIDNVRVGPSQSLTQGTPVTDWQRYTPTFTGFGTPSDVYVYSRRVGDSLEIDASFVTGTTTGVNATMTLGHNGIDGGIVIDPSKITAQGATNQLVGYSRLKTNTSNSYTILANGPQNNILFFGQSSASNDGMSAELGTTISAGSQQISFFACVPILGWSSSVVLSENTDTRLVEAIVSGTPGSGIGGSPNIIGYSTKDKDTHNTYSIGAGQYTVPVTGDYLIKAQYLVTGTIAANDTAVISARKNGTIIRQKVINIPSGITQVPVSVECTIYDCRAGDLLDVTSTTSITSPSFSGGAVDNYFEINRISSPETIAASEVVRARYKTSAGAALVASTQIDYDTLDYDTHGAVTTGAGWKFTAPKAGIVQISTMLTLDGATANGITIYKNGISESGLGFTQSNIGGTNGIIQGMTTVAVVAGDTLDIRPTSTAANLSADANYNYIDIKLD